MHHSLANILNLLRLTLVSFSLQLLCPIPIEARNLPSHVSFKADLIHRNPPLSPYYDSLLTPQERQLRATLGSVSLGHKIKLSSTYFDQKAVKTDIVRNGGDYLMEIAVGTPPVEFSAVVDTGSNLIWLQCSPCEHCIEHDDSPLFEPNKSSTYHVIPCNSQSCNYPDLDSGCQPNSLSNNEFCAYSAKYGDGTKSTGILGTDTISFPSADATQQPSFPSSTFGCGYDQQGQLGVHGDGIVGLGLGTSSLVSQLGQDINYKFSYCLTPLSSDGAGKLQFGLGVTQPGAVSTPFTTDDPPTIYSLRLNGISISNSSVDVAQDIIIDSGTTLTFLPTSVYDGVKTTMKSAIALSSVPDPNNVFDPCYKVQPSDGGFNPPDVVFHFKGADVVLKAINTFRTLDNLTCLAIVPSDDALLFGNIAQVNFEVGYDLKAKQVSFAPTDCTKY